MNVQPNLSEESLITEDVREDDVREEDVREEDDRGNPSGILDIEPTVTELVGLANLPNQVYRAAVKKGFEFTIMVAGMSGLGKSTLINSLFLTDIYIQKPNQTLAIETTKVLLEENGVNLHLTVVDTPGFGNAVDNSNCWAPIIDYIESKNRNYFDEETRVSRRQFQDERVHCCLYFIQPTGHGLKALDIECMKRLCVKVNLIPLIAKADTLTPDECALFKRQILEEIIHNKIAIYNFSDTDDDEVETSLNQSLKKRVPFAVVGANTTVEVGGRAVRAREYPWGVVNVEDLAHSDLFALRDMLIRTHMQDLKDVTNSAFYEEFRYHKMVALSNARTKQSVSNNILLQVQEDNRAHKQRLKEIEEKISALAERKIRQMQQVLNDTEYKLTEEYERMKNRLEQDAKELHERRRTFEMEKERWEREH